MTGIRWSLILLLAGTLFLLVMSILAYCFYAADKRYAKQGRRRTPEKVLLSLGFFGGAAGALLAMQTKRHKTKHWYFWVVNILGLLWQLPAAGFLIWLCLPHTIVCA